MSDVLFDFGKYTLKPEAREKAGKGFGNFAGISKPEAYK
jgi:hypothetical protein